MFSTILSIVLVSAAIGAAAYFLIKQVHEKPKNGNGSTGNSDNNTEDHNDTSGHGGEPGWSK